MTGRPLIIRPTRLETSIPEDLRAKLDLHLMSPLEGRVPKGAYQAFILELMRDFFARGWQAKDIELRIETSLATTDILRKAADIMYKLNPVASLPARKIIQDFIRSIQNT
jgi:hypothetical protein